MSGVDVLGVMNSQIRGAEQDGKTTAIELRMARTAFAVLIQWDEEYDDALQALTDLNRRIAENGWIDIEHDALRKAGDRLVRAKNFRAIALRRVRGGAE